MYALYVCKFIEKILNIKGDKIFIYAVLLHSTLNHILYTCDYVT